MGTLRQVRRRWTTLGVVILALLVAWIVFPKPFPASDQGNPENYFRVTPVYEYEQWGSNPLEFYVTEKLASMTTEQKVRALIISNTPGVDVAVLESYVSTNDLSGFILMGSNIPASPEELAATTALLSGDSELPRLIAIDEEGGLVTRLPWDSAAGANTLRNEPLEATFLAFSSRAELLHNVGITTNFGIVADVSADSRSFIFERSFGSDGVVVGERVATAVLAEHPNVLSTLKHFPGHGSAPGDSHVGIPVSSLGYDQWFSSDALPFRAGIGAGAQLVMFGHLSFPEIDATPSSLSLTWHDILRDELGFTGIIITDDMTMLEASGLPEYSDPGLNAVRALQAGNDVLLYVPRVDFDLNTVVSAIVSAVNAGQISLDQIDQSVTKVLTQRRLLYPEAETWVPHCDERCVIWKTF